MTIALTALFPGPSASAKKLTRSLFFRLTNNTPLRIAGLTNGFRLYSPQSLQWSHPSGPSLPPLENAFEYIFVNTWFGLHNVIKIFDSYCRELTGGFVSVGQAETPWGKQQRELD
jgi:hypothetical protein